jgi:uncharacterized membrane protein
MEALVFVGGVLAIVAVIGAALGWVSFFALNETRRTVEELRGEVRRLRVQSEARTARSVRSDRGSAPSTSAPTEPHAPARDLASTRAADRAREAEHPMSASADEGRDAEFDEIDESRGEPGVIAALAVNIRENWMIWLGGLSVGLAGIFLVQYSIARNLLGPTARIAAALITGLVLHAAAEWLRRRTASAHPAFAALAGGASITLYAATFAALQLYELLSPGMAFVMLAIVSLLTMALALLHGPVLAIIGILGAYIVPVLVSNESGNILVAFVYSLMVTGAALLLMRYVYRPWLWYGMLLGSLGWWAISFSGIEANDFRGLYLAALAYLYLAVPVFDWRLSRVPVEGDPATETSLDMRGWRSTPLQSGLILAALAHAFSVSGVGFTGLTEALVQWTPLLVVLMLATRHRTQLGWLPWLMLASQWLAWFYRGLDARPSGIEVDVLPAMLQAPFLRFAAAMSVLFSGLAWWVSRDRPFQHARASLICMAPVLWLALAYLLVTDRSPAWEWSVASALLGLVYMFLAGTRLGRRADDSTSAWLILGGHLAYSLAVAMYFREAGLTLALAAQLLSLAWIMQRFGLGFLRWLVKAVLAVVVARLTFNPWLASYPPEVHWSLWTYGGAFLFAAAAAWITPVQAELRKWLEAAALHLLVLFLGAETRYWLYDGRIFIDEITLTEAAINTSLWASLGLTYFYRAQVSTSLGSFYTICSRVLVILAVASYAASLTIFNPLWSDAVAGTTPVLNILLLAYGAPVLLALVYQEVYLQSYRNSARVVAAAGAFIFVTMEIRHLWQRALDLDLPTGNAELYTYSIVWLVIAVGTILESARRDSTHLYRAGMALLLIVIGKIFLVDMSDLEGLLRVASFMGLGLSLLGLAFLHQRITKSRPVPV